MASATELTNKQLAVEAFDTLVNKRDFRAAERYFAPDYVQHDPRIPTGRDGLFEFVRRAPPRKYEPGLVVAEGEYVAIHARVSGDRPTNLIVVDFLRIVDGVLVEHWDVTQDEATRAESKSGHPMFGDVFPK